MAEKQKQNPGYSKSMTAIKYLDKLTSLFFILAWIFTALVQMPIAIIMASVAVVIFIVWLILCLCFVKEKPSKEYTIFAIAVFAIAIIFTVLFIIFQYI